MFYAEVTDGHRAGPGGGLAEEGELIEVVHLPLDGAQAFADNPDAPRPSASSLVSHGSSAAWPLAWVPSETAWGLARGRSWPPTLQTQ